MRPWACIALFLLIGCEKNRSVSSVIAQATGSTAPIPGTHKTVLIMGQSNAAGLNSQGHFGWNAERRSEDTIINCAQGGTSLDQWHPSGGLFQGCISKAQGYTIDVILWYQGEYEAEVYPFPDYAYRLTQYFSVWRTTFGTDVTILYAQLGQVDLVKLWYYAPHWADIQAEQASITYPNSAMVRTDGIIEGGPLQNDGVHYTPKGYYELGRTFARAYKNMGLN